MPAIGRLLGQLRPANTTAASVYSPAAGVRAQVLQIVVCNTTGSAATCRIFHDDDGTTYDETTALYFDKSVAANDSLFVDFSSPPGLAMVNPDGSIGVRTGTNNALTFSVYGYEHS